MKRFLLALVATLFFFHPFAYADRDGKLVFNLNYNDPCRSVSATYFTHARHAKGNRGGRLNENNFGYAGSCYHDTGKNFYTIVGALENSQRGGTFLVGPGVRFRTPQLFGIALEAGIEIPFVYYEIPKYRSYVYGFLPIQYFGLSFQIPMMYGRKLGTLELGQRRFGQGGEKITLASFGWRHEF